ncbi:hypothetical protein C0J52_20417 [Blattella germanica]|nr:hypothetical protein C0J52_20417 [Blattella germanica]
MKNMEEDTYKQIDNDVLRELKCQLCKKYMEPPIFLCNNHHNTCKTCQRGSYCPFCNTKVLIRNLALENIAKTVVYPCEHKDSGCTAELPLDMRKSHASGCFFRLLNCPFAKYAETSCSWIGFLSDIKRHVLTDHEFETDSRQEKGAFSVSLKDFSVSKRYIVPVAKLDELFFIIWEMREEDFFCVVVLIGTKEETEDYMYRFTIIAPNKMEIISICLVVQSYLDDLEKILQPGESITLRYGTVTKFKNEQNALICEIEIYESGERSIEILRKFEVKPSKILSIVPRSFFPVIDNEDAESKYNYETRPDVGKSY